MKAPKGRNVIAWGDAPGYYIAPLWGLQIIFKQLLKGEIIRDECGTVSLKWRGKGIPDSPTEGWVYDYKAYLAPTFRKATDKTIVLIGSVTRTLVHGKKPAGVIGTFYMVKLD